MNSVSLPEDCAKQWEILLLLLSSEEKKIDRTGDSEIDTMNYFCNNEGVRKILLQWMSQMKSSYAKKMSESDTALKCDEVSLLWRQRGNDKFRANCLEGSYQCYTKSVLYAVQAGSMYPLALANRSATLLRMKRFKECLDDVALAIDSGYPLQQRHKLLLRRSDCYIELGQRDNAKKALDDAIKHAATLNLSPNHSAEFDRHIKMLERKLEVVVQTEPEDVDVLPEVHNGQNPQFHNASNSIELRRSETAGRYVATTEAVRRGDVLFSEEPYAWVALGDGDVCETCCRAHVNCIPCRTCSRSIYCSKSCCAKAQHAFHQWECDGAQAELFSTIGIAHLALRVLRRRAASKGFPSVPPSQPAPTSALELFHSYAAVNDIQIYRSDTPDFYRMFNLVTNFDKMNNTDYIQYALTATLLTLYLESYTSFFEYLPSRLPCALPAREVRLFAAALMLRGLGQLVCNGHAALSLDTVEDDEQGGTVTEKEVRRATAIYPSAAMMNHSCDPNIINTFYNSRLIIVSGRELPAGSQVWNCYGPHRARRVTSLRRAQLRAQYLFTCDCAHCADPQAKDTVLLFTAYACQSCKGPVVWSGRGAACPQCRAELRLERALAVIEQADELQVRADQADTLEKRCSLSHAALRLKQQVWHRHHTSLRAAADNLARLYASAGEYSKSVELIKQNIQSLEYQFGSFSVEVAHELRKLADVMLERMINSPQNPDYRDWCLETHKIIKKAVQLMELNYGSWEPLVKRLKQQAALVAEQLAQLADSRTPDAADCVHNTLHYNLKI